MKNLLLATTLFILTTACAPLRKQSEKPSPKETEITLTPQELAEAFAYRESKQAEEFNRKLQELSKKIGTLRDQIANDVRDCICPAGMK